MTVSRLTGYSSSGRECRKWRRIRSSGAAEYPRRRINSLTILNFERRRHQYRNPPGMANDGAIPLNRVKSQVPDGRPSFVEVARPTTGELPSVAPTSLENGLSRVVSVNARPTIFRSTGKELLIISICTWAPASQVFSL